MSFLTPKETIHNVLIKNTTDYTCCCCSFIKSNNTQIYPKKVLKEAQQINVFFCQIFRPIGDPYCGHAFSAGALACARTGILRLYRCLQRQARMLHYRLDVITMITILFSISNIVLLPNRQIVISTKNANI